MPENSAFLDVGAHNGDTVFTMALHARTHGRDDIRFFAFEPDKEKTKFIIEVAQKNNLNVKVYTNAIGNKTQNVSPNRDMRLHSGAVSYSKKSDGNIKMIPLDSLPELGEVGFLHLDVEGWESKVLEGCHNILKRYTPIIVAEVWCPQSAKKRGFSVTPKEDIDGVIKKYGDKFIRGADIKDGNRNMLYLPRDRDAQ